ncbi:MAG: riboflavin kinase, partial [Pseudomonadota bacterium]
SSQSADAFVDDILVRGLKVGHVATGYDFHFGHKRQGTPEFLVKSGRDAGFGVSIVEAYTGASGEPIASSIIREALSDGDLDLVHRQLGYRYSISATVIHGDKRGRDLGYPTANMILQSESTLKYGVYAVRVRTADGVHEGVANFGRRPQYDNGSILLEAHLFDYAGDLYGADIEVEFVAYLRAEMSFDGVNALIAQMDRDSARSRDILDGIKGAPFGPEALRSVAP